MKEVSGGEKYQWRRRRSFNTAQIKKHRYKILFVGMEELSDNTDKVGTGKKTAKLVQERQPG